MNNIIFIGGGGFFNELFEYVKIDIESGALKNYRIKGLIDDRELLNTPALYLGTVKDYVIQENDIFIIAIGNAQIRSKIYDLLKNKNAKFLTYIHSNAIIAKSASIGDSCIICPNSIVNANAVIDDGVALNVFCSVGHDSKIGAHTVMSPYSAVNGNACVGDRCFLGTRATVFPQITIGNDVIIDSHSYAKSNIDSEYMVSLRTDYRVIKNRLLKR